MFSSQTQVMIICASQYFSRLTFASFESRPRSGFGFWVLRVTASRSEKLSRSENDAENSASESENSDSERVTFERVTFGI